MHKMADLREEEREYVRRYFFTPTPLERNGGFWPVRLGYCIAKPSYNSIHTTIASYSLHFILKGGGVFIQNQRQYRLKKGDLFCLFPNIPHQYYTDKENNLQMMWINFDGKQAESILERLGLRPDSPHLSTVMNPKIMNKLKGLFSHFRQSEESNQDMLRSSLMLHLFHTIMTSAPAQNLVERDDSTEWLDKGLAYMKQNYTQGITVQEVADYVGVDRSHFSKMFQKTFNTPPSKYLMSLMMDEAEKLVKETDLRFSEIASLVGFPDLYAFSKAFKMYFGISPTRSRQL